VESASRVRDAIDDVSKSWIEELGDDTRALFVGVNAVS
jgi:hypothetical protein